ncbi:hypothetical protein L7F22_041354 [Adiantum nelumboides]|nr:hypothetical protein [Adiantum nelumboides]
MAEETLRSSAWRCLRSSHYLRTPQKLALLHNFLNAFSRLGDVESELVLRYEILCLRESSGSAEMKVDVSEWSSFAEDCLSAGFPGNANKAFEKLISQMQSHQTLNEGAFCNMQSFSKHVQSNVMVEVNVKLSFPEFLHMHTGAFEKGSCNESPSDPLYEKSSTTVSTCTEGLKRKERAKLRMLQARKACCME